MQKLKGTYSTSQGFTDFRDYVQDICDGTES